MPKKVVKKYTPNQKEKYMYKTQEVLSERLLTWRKEIVNLIMKM